MYDNIGRKIKGLAKLILVIGLIACIVGGIIMISKGRDMNYYGDSPYVVVLESGDGLIMRGIVTIILGPILIWISTLVLYGFGELVEKTCEIESKMRSSGNGDNSRAMAKLELISKIEKLYEEGSISEEEYKERKKRIFDII